MSLSASSNVTANGQTFSGSGTLYIAANSECTVQLQSTTSVLQASVSVSSEINSWFDETYRVKLPAGSVSFRLPDTDITLSVTVTVSDGYSVSSSQFYVYAVKGNSLSVLTFGADPTGSVDSLAAVNAAAAALSGTGVALLFTAGTYDLSALPTIPDNLAVQIGPGATFTGAGGATFAALYGYVTWPQGGTLLAPAPTQLWQVRPRDPAKASYGAWIIASTNIDNATTDNVMHVGYNVLDAVTTEPGSALSFEQNFEVSAGVYQMETHIQYYTANQTENYRPFTSTFLRNTADVGALAVGFNWNDPNKNGKGYWYQQEATSGKQFMYFDGVQGSQTRFIDLAEPGRSATSGAIRLDANGVTYGIRAHSRVGAWDIALIYGDQFDEVNIGDGTKVAAVIASVASGGAHYRQVAGANVIAESAAGAAYSIPIKGDGSAKMLSVGRLAKTLPGDANYTLTATEYANSIIEVSGTTTATRNVVLPIQSGAIAWVANLLSSAQSLQFIGATGTGVTVANNKRAILYCDGTNWVRMTPDT